MNGEKKGRKKERKHYILIWVQYIETLNMPNLQNGDDDDDVLMEHSGVN